MVNRDIEDRLINPLNNIVLLTCEMEIHQEKEKEVDKIINVLVNESIIAERIKYLSKT